MNQSPDATSSLPGPWEDPFKNWPNGDLLIDEEDRGFFARHFPAFAPIFDWPELRSLFVTYDAPAAKARRRSRHSGIFAVLVGVFSLILAATIPLVGDDEGNNLQAAVVPSDVAPARSEAVAANAAGAKESNPDRKKAVIGSFVAFLAVLSVIFGYTQLLTGRAKSRWITNRFWTERIRQFHFQLIVNHLEEVIATVNSKEHLQKWLAFRATQLDKFHHDYFRGAEDKIHHLELDEAEDNPWIFDEWEHSGPIPAARPELDVVLKLMEQQRFGIQERYAEKKLRHGLYSPATLADWILRQSDNFTFVLLVATIAAGVGPVLVVSGHGSRRIHFVAALIAAVASALVVAMRAFKEGMLFNADAERYKWYLAAVRMLHRRYERADLPRKIFLLRELERTAYQEMRRFISSAKQAQFVM